MAVAPIRARTMATGLAARRSLTINPAAPACPASQANPVNRASPDGVVRVAKAVSPDRPASQANPDSQALTAARIAAATRTAAARRSASQAIRIAAKTSNNQQPALISGEGDRKVALSVCREETKSPTLLRDAGPEFDRLVLRGDGRSAARRVASLG
jgi:hypothetical protein